MNFTMRTLLLKREIMKAPVTNLTPIVWKYGKSVYHYQRTFNKLIYANVLYIYCLFILYTLNYPSHDIAEFSDIN